MAEKEIERQGAVTQHKKERSVNEHSVELKGDIKNSEHCPEPISELSNRFLNEGN